MTPYPGFGEVLRRLLEHRGVDATEVARDVGVAESELRAVLATS